MKSKRSQKDKARRRKPSNPLAAMAAKRFDDILERYFKSARIENLKVFDNPDFQFKRRPFDLDSAIFDKENIDIEDVFTEMINHFKISCGLQID